ncbi:MAG: proprotein convertase P-domain-containing protein [Flavobacterium sp.]|nr:proprotein convertase P-domain-containing protein [Flavobacterium sp.]
MKFTFPFLCAVFMFVIFIQRSYGQPPNDTCVTAQTLVVGVGSCTSILYTNVAATTIGNPATPSCWSPNTMSNTVWFSFVATTADVEISTNFAGTLGNTQIAVYSGACGSLVQIGCQEDVNTIGGLLHTDVILHGLTVNNTYYIAVDGNGNTTGTFGVCVQQSLPIGPPLPIQDCAGAQTLCSPSALSVPDGVGGVGSTQEAPTCFGAPGERSSNWYTFTAATSGNLAFTITPTVAVDYDFAIFDTTTACLGTELSCNWSPALGANGTTGLGCPGGQCEPVLAVTAGQTYTILVDRFTAASNAGFALDFTGTTATFASPNPTFTATTACIGTATQFTNTTNGNFTYSWNFGDGFTSNLENPSHVFATAGPQSVTLLVTAVPGGCQNSITQTVTVNPLPTVNAGAGGSVCPGACINLSGSTNAVGSVGPLSFSNNTLFPIPDGNIVGVNSPIIVSGIVPTTVANTSIASVCINLTHTWDSDLDIFLQCPNGTIIQLSTDNGGLGENYTNTCFTPTAISPITAGTAPFTGTYAPEDSFALLNGCNSNGTWNLFVQDDIGGDLGSINNWTITFNNNLPPFTWSPTTAMTNATTLTPTVCPLVPTTYTLTANNGVGCTTTSQVTIGTTAGPTATISYPSASVCTTSGTQAATLAGTGSYTGGTYSSTLGLTINSSSGLITPSSSTPGPYTITYTIPASGSCPATTTTTTLTINAPPNAGVDGSVAVCDSSVASIDLFSLITGEQASGVWTQSSGSGGTFNAGVGTFVPALGASTSTFTYTVAGAGPCPPDSSVVTITINPQANAGADGSVTLCDSSVASIDLFSLITGEQAGGVWTQSSGSGGTFNAGAGTFVPALGASTSTFAYTVAGAGPCPPDSSVVTITINPQANAGVDGSVTVCDSSVTSIDLFSLIAGEQAGGVWTQSSGSGGTFNAGVGTFVPALGASTSTFTYTVAGAGPCPPDSSVVTITINPQANAGVDGSVTVCDSSVASIDLFSLITGEQAGGVWTQSSGSGGTFNAGVGTFVPALGASTSTFTYTVAGAGPCPPDSSVVTITINPQANAGVDGSVTVCDSSVASIDLFSLITGEQAGGVWTQSSGSGGTFNAGAGTFVPALGASTSTFTYTVAGAGPCPPDSSVVTITINPQPNAGVDGSVTVCDSSVASIDLFSLIAGEQAGGVWTQSSGSGGTFNAGAGTFCQRLGASTSTFTPYSWCWTLSA